MLYALICTDKPDALDLRMATREDHVAYLKSSDILKQAGPFLGDDGNMNGSLLILECESRAQAESFAQNDPYQKAGLFASVEIREWNRVISE